MMKKEVPVCGCCTNVQDYIAVHVDPDNVLRDMARRGEAPDPVHEWQAAARGGFAHAGLTPEDFASYFQQAELAG